MDGLREAQNEPQPHRPLSVGDCVALLHQLLHELHSIETEFAAQLAAVAEDYRASAVNLVHYLALRRHDLRPLQETLSSLGLSSLAYCEPHVRASLEAVLRAVSCQLDNLEQIPVLACREALAHRSCLMLGHAPAGREVRIMVTLPSEAATDQRLLVDLLEAGMNLARINCAHDGPEVWLQMLENLRRAELLTGHLCPVSFDLAGPKLRTGPVRSGPAVRHLKPKRDALGTAEAPYRVQWVAPGTVPHAGQLPLPEPFVARLQVGDELRFADTRGRDRSMTVIDTSGDGWWAEGWQGCYLVPGLELELCREGEAQAIAPLPEFPPTPGALTLQEGDRLRVLAEAIPGEPARLDEQGHLREPARISCSLPAVFESIAVGQRVMFDDGKLVGRVATVQPGAFEVDLRHIIGGRARLRADKGINLPDTTLPFPALTEADRLALEFVRQHGDMVALSFVRTVDDLEELLQLLAQPGPRTQLGIILKIETQQAFENLPLLLLKALQHPPVAVMVARGDLGVEVGFERLSEVQEEILWFCEAAHVPVIWATQVLESLAKGGAATRAEVSDAAMACRAECVMLNKGPYIRDAVRFLDDILRRAQENRIKRRVSLRRLQVSLVHP